MFRINSFLQGYRRWWFTAAGVFGLLFSIGCGSGDPFNYHRVSGKVTYDDGSLIPAERITVTFYPQVDRIDAKTHPRPGKAEVNVADGTFNQITSHEHGDGVVRGKHKVTIAALDSQGRVSTAIPLKYSHPKRTPLEVDSAESPYLFEIKKPR